MFLLVYEASQMILNSTVYTVYGYEVLRPPGICI